MDFSLFWWTGLLPSIVIGIGIAFIQMSDFKHAKITFTLLAAYIEVVAFVWAYQSINTLFFRVLIVQVVTELIILGIMGVFHYINSKDQLAKVPDTNIKIRQIILPLNGLIAKAERILREYEGQREMAANPNLESTLYAVHRANAILWQKEVEYYIQSNFPEHYLNSLDFNQDFTPGGIRFKVNTLKEEIKKLESQN